MQDKPEYSISIIVPLYRGAKYMPGMTAQIEACAKCTPNVCFELVYSNDAPDDKIKKPDISSIPSLKIINTAKNRGIHAARLKGLQKSTGDYILFLDQDDKITPEYFRSQLDAIGSADAVICNALSGGRMKYNVDRPLDKAVSRECMIREGNMILSPGQVLLRREAIPESWTEKAMAHNGADDWLLWLCMYSENKTFALNREVLFIRELHYRNASFDCLKMEASEREAVELVEEKGLLCAEEREALRELLPRLQEKRIKENEKWKKMFMVLNDWFRICDRGMSVAGYLEARKVRRAAIYGYGYLGRTLCGNLEKGNVEVSYIIDKNAAFLEPGKKCHTLDDMLEPVDAVIITIESADRNAVEDRIKEKLDGQIFWLEDIIFGLSRQLRGQ